jgi:cytochrome P450
MTQAIPAPAELNAMAEQMLDDPYPIYELLRGMGQVVYLEHLDRWMVTGHRQALALLRDDRLSSDRTRWRDYEPPEGMDRVPGGMVMLDPPVHTRLRSLVSQVFSPRTVEQLRPRIELLVTGLLDEAQERGEIELMADFAGPLPATVLAEVLGIPAADHRLFRTWTTTLIDSIDPVSVRLETSEPVTKAREATEAYLLDVISERRKQPRDDLISALVQVEQAGDKLSEAELLEMCYLLVVAGLQTTANLIGNGTDALFEHPEQHARLRAEPGLIGSAVEELLRYDGPIQVSGRVPTEDVEIDGHLLREGQMVGVLIGAANRDPEVFADPDQLDVGRTPNNHLAFGRGIHFCLGGPLARIEGSVALGALISRFPDLRRAGEAERRRSIHVRGFVSLPVSVT